jgi:hypothetical protein
MHHLVRRHITMTTTKCLHIVLGHHIKETSTLLARLLDSNVMDCFGLVTSRHVSFLLQKVFLQTHKRNEVGIEKE